MTRRFSSDRPASDAVLAGRSRWRRSALPGRAAWHGRRRSCLPRQDEVGRSEAVPGQRYVSRSARGVRIAPVSAKRVRTPYVRQGPRVLRGVRDEPAGGDHCPVIDPFRTRLKATAPEALAVVSALLLLRARSMRRSPSTKRLCGVDEVLDRSRSDGRRLRVVFARWPRIDESADHAQRASLECGGALW